MTIRIHKNQLKQELLATPVLIGGVVTSLLYIVVSTLIMNRVLVSEIVIGAYPLLSKTSILLSLMLGAGSLYEPFELLAITIMGFLMGVNIVLLVQSFRLNAKRVSSQKKKGSWSLGLGFVGMLATTGCASCGVSLLSVIAPTISLTLFPFSGLVLQGVSLGLLIFSLIHILNQRGKACIITTS